LNPEGDVIWKNCYGGKASDFAHAIIQTADGGYVCCGSSTSINGDVTGHHGTTNTADQWILKLSALGTVEWENSFGGGKSESGLDIVETAEDEYFVVGYQLQRMLM
jgi:hypothetical protein